MYNGVGGGEGVHHVADGTQLVRLHALYARPEEMELAGHLVVACVSSFEEKSCQTSADIELKDGICGVRM